MALKFEHELRDPIHGLIRLTDQEMRIVNTQAFQRLRRIRQLAMADLVYPGALHTRFEHSIGTLHVAEKILSHSDIIEHTSSSDRRIVRLASLLHDIGHGPFSHVSEYLLERHYDPKKVSASSAREKIHEKITIDTISKWHEFDDLLTTDEKNEIVSIIEGSKNRDFKRDIVSSSLDADKMDYLLRDAHFAGVNYGLFDLDKIVDACRRYQSGPETYLVIDEDGLFAVEQLVVAKYHMTQQVYSHRVRLVTDSMIVRGLELAIEDRVPHIRDLYRYDGSIGFLRRYFSWDDSTIISSLINTRRSDKARYFFQRLHERRLLKELSVFTLTEKDVPDAITRSRLINLDDELKRGLEERISQELGCEPWQVIVLDSSIRNPIYQDPDVLDPEAIMVLSRSGTITREMKDYPYLLSANMPRDRRVHVIGPLDSSRNTSRSERQQKRQEMNNLVKNIILDFVEG